MCDFSEEEWAEYLRWKSVAIARVASPSARAPRYAPVEIETAPLTSTAET
jgi:hypothetical protein